MSLTLCRKALELRSAAIDITTTCPPSTPSMPSVSCSSGCLINFRNFVYHLFPVVFDARNLCCCDVANVAMPWKRIQHCHTPSECLDQRIPKIALLTREATLSVMSGQKKLSALSANTFAGKRTGFWSAFGYAFCGFTSLSEVYGWAVLTLLWYFDSVLWHFHLITVNWFQTGLGLHQLTQWWRRYNSAICYQLSEPADSWILLSCSCIAEYDKLTRPSLKF